MNLISLHEKTKDKLLIYYKYMKKNKRKSQSNPDPYEDIVKLEKLDPYEALIKFNLLKKTK